MEQKISHENNLMNEIVQLKKTIDNLSHELESLEKEKDILIKEKESELKFNKENYRFLFEHSPVMILEYDLSGVYDYYLSLHLKNLEEFKEKLVDRSTGVLEKAWNSLNITDVNEYGVKLLKAPNKQDIIEHFDHYYTYNTFSAYLDNIVLVFSGLLENQFETDLISSDGQLIDVLITWHIAPGHEKRFSKIFIIIVDITEQKQLQKNLIEMQKLDSLGLLAGGIAHDLNNLLAPILGRINIIQSSFNGSQEVLDHLKIMEETTLRASELVRQLLTYSGKGKFVTDTCNLNDVLNKTKYLINVTATKKVEIKYKLAKSLPDIEADETQIQQVIMNLVSNAASAINYSGKLLIETILKTLDETELQQSYKKFGLKQGEYVILKITDKGIGIQESIRDKIYDPFFSTKSAGRGLGLSVVLGIVKTHQGGIHFESELGKGTTFTVIFPKNKSSLEKNLVTEKVIKEKSFHKFVQAVVCDDEPSVREITSLMLKKIGIKVFEAESGSECIELFKKENIDLIFTDLTMPNMDGVTVIKEIRKINKLIPIILMSGYNKHEIELQLSGYNINGFLQKPFTLDLIKEKLTSLA